MYSPPPLHHQGPNYRFSHYTTPKKGPNIRKAAEMAVATANPLLSTTRASDTSPTVQLHPLVLLTISDCITRHTLRQQEGPIAGAILGQQNGQEITMEVAFQAKLKSNADGDVVLDDEWFSKRLEDCKFPER
jgi:COP9 signalosome complex subunit 6